MAAKGIKVYFLLPFASGAADLFRKHEATRVAPVTAQLCEWGARDSLRKHAWVRGGSSDQVANAPQGAGFFCKRQLFGAEQEETKNSGTVMDNVEF